MYKNRYGDEFDFVKVNENTYKIVGDLKYWRYGGKEGQDGINKSDLGFVDPSGGPFMSAGTIIEGREVKRIFIEKDGDGDQILFEVE